MANHVFGVDVGGTTVKLGLFDINGNVLDKWEIPTRTEENGKKILPDIAASIEAKIAEKNLTKEDIAGVGPRRRLSLRILHPVLTYCLCCLPAELC